jgi:hypothetical protein
MNMTFTQLCHRIFNESIRQYHVLDHVDTDMRSPYPQQSIEHCLFLKNWIDTVQWHLEDIIRKPDIDPVEALQIKRRIDRSNQERTDLVERIDGYFMERYKDVAVLPHATVNTESPAWAVDRLSILELKIYHMEQEVNRPDASPEHRERCRKKQDVLLEQEADLSGAIDALLDDIANGRKYMKAYKQMKMYNDPKLNPALYKH